MSASTDAVRAALSLAREHWECCARIELLRATGAPEDAPERRRAELERYAAGARLAAGMHQLDAEERVAFFAAWRLEEGRLVANRATDRSGGA